MNLQNYDIYHLGISGGKDSTALLLWAVYESGLPIEKLDATFCDTGNEDALTYAYLEMLSRKVHPIKTIRPERDFWELAKHKKRFPSRMARFCTSHLKIIPSRNYVLDMQRDGANVLLLNGVRKSEGKAHNDRGTVPMFGWDEGFACDAYRPILEWDIDKVWAIHKKYLRLFDVFELIEADPHLSGEHKAELITRMGKHGIPRNPLYDMGATRVGCFPCINSRKSEIRAMDKYRPERIDFIELKEAEVGHARNDNMPTFFAIKTTPVHNRSKLITSAAGEEMMVATIRDVVEWSKTARGGKQYEFDFEIDSPPIACDLGGMCE